MLATCSCPAPGRPSILRECHGTGVPDAVGLPLLMALNCRFPETSFPAFPAPALGSVTPGAIVTESFSFWTSETLFCPVSARNSDAAHGFCAVPQLTRMTRPGPPSFLLAAAAAPRGSQVPCASLWLCHGNTFFQVGARPRPGHCRPLLLLRKARCGPLFLALHFTAERKNNG